MGWSRPDTTSTSASRHASSVRVSRYSPGRKLRRLDVPVLLQVGSRDETTQPAAAMKFARRSPSTTVRVHDTGHFEPYVGEALRRWRRRADRFPRPDMDGAPSHQGRAHRHHRCGRRDRARDGAAVRGHGLDRLCHRHQHGSARRAQAGVGRAAYLRRDGRDDTAAIERVFAAFAARYRGGPTPCSTTRASRSRQLRGRSARNHELVVQVNVEGVVNCTHLALWYLSKGVAPQVIGMSSRASDYGVPSEATYSASKFFVRGFTEAMNIEWERLGIHLCDILPNFVDTPMMQAAHGGSSTRSGSTSPSATSADGREGPRTARRCIGWSTLPKNDCCAPSCTTRGGPSNAPVHVKHYAGF